MRLDKLYTRVIGILFILVLISFTTDYLDNGFTAESMHKIFHVVLGILVIAYGWDNKRFWKPFALANGGFFTFVALFGLMYPNFGGLDAFNLVDTILHSLVGLSGLAIGVFYKK